MTRAVVEWLDRRTAFRALTRHVLDEPIPGGARWAYVFGSGLLCLFLFQALTGVFLACFYSPSTREAWGSVYFLSHELRLGWFVRGLHHWGASAMVLVLVAHLLQVVVYGAYRSPRELGWWTGLFLLFVVLGFSFTGYLLPWDQHGFGATREVLGLVRTLPAIGPSLARVLGGGDEPGNFTLLRAYVVHVLALPALLALLAGMHVALFRRHGVTPRPRRGNTPPRRESFWPRQAGFDLAFALLLTVATAAITLWRHGAPLEAPGDPTADYVARPAWYFRWLFELRRLFPAPHEAVGVLTVCTGTLAFLFALPLLDRGPSAALRHRWHFVLVVVAMVGYAAISTVVSLQRDAHGPAAESRRTAELSASRAFQLAADGIPPGGPGQLYENDPWERGRWLFAEHCASCHNLDGAGGTAPDLGDYASHAWVRGVIADPTTPRYFGGTEVSGMDPSDATADELDTLTEYVLALGGRGTIKSAGAELFEEKGCASCHARAGEESVSGPSLDGYGSRPWIAGVIRHPADPRYYGDASRMTPFEGTLTNAEIDDLIEFLVTRR